MTAHTGDKIRCREAVETHGLIHYKAPFTGGFECRIPAGPKPLKRISSIAIP